MSALSRALRRFVGKIVGRVTYPRIIPIYINILDVLFGGQGGIRTLERLLTVTHFPGVRLQPLGHLSIWERGEYTVGRRRARAAQGANIRVF